MAHEIGNSYKCGEAKVRPPEGGGDLAAGDLVLDVLSTHDASEVSVAALCLAGEVCGFRDQNVRVALNRLVRQGKVANPARGMYALKADGSGLFAEVESWLRKEQRAVGWQGGWIGVLDGAVPRREKTLWRRHERALALRGFRALGDSGLQLRPDNLHGGVAALRDDLRGLGLAPQASVIAVSGLSGADERRAQALWDLDGLERQYLDMLARLEHSQSRLHTQAPEAAARESLLLGRAAIRLIIRDPLLPDALMEGDARHRLIERMRDYQAHAKTLWMRLLQGA
ncbi:MAG: phenylacetic acid degradation operon negative regulatory protein [Alloalcanivorax sp.]|jgi:phenylacetic acid degradation operon negative regulatory protein